MICKQCANAADNAIVKELNPVTNRYVNIEPEHCNGDSTRCDCQHKEQGSWSGSPQ